MIIRFLRTGNGQLEPRHFKIQLARRIKTLFIVAYFFGIVFAWGDVDIVAMFRASQSEQKETLTVPAMNRAQRRRLTHAIKKQQTKPRHVQAA